MAGRKGVEDPASGMVGVGQGAGQDRVGGGSWCILISSASAGCNLLMRQGDRVCHRVSLKSAKEREIYLKREENYIEHTPKIIVGKLENNVQEIWTQDLRSEPVVRLKELNSSEKAFSYARCVMLACLRLAPRYGSFIINENMVFFNPQRDIFAWINPEILENTVKIYLPSSPEGEAAMLRSILTYLKLWLKADYNFLAEAKRLDELIARFDQLRAKMHNEGFRAQSPDRDFLANRKNSANFQPGDMNFIRYSSNGLKAPDYSHQLAENRSNRQLCLDKSPGKQQQIGEKLLVKSLSNKQKYLVLNNYQNSSEKQQKQAAKNKTSLSRNTDQISDKVESVEHDYEHKTFNNPQSGKTSVNQSLGLKGSSNYFPNRTTSNKHHPIVQLINSQDVAPDEYRQNKILIDDQNDELEREKLRRMKDSLDGIGEEVNELFFSNVESDGNKEEEMKKIEEEFGSLLD